MTERGSILTSVQVATLRAIDADPSGRLCDWAEARGISIHAIHAACDLLARKGYLAKIKRGRRSSRYVLTERCGRCTCCGRPQFSESLHTIEETHCPKTTPRIREHIVMSKGRTSAVAERFGLEDSHVRNLRRKARRRAASSTEQAPTQTSTGGAA